MNYIEYFCWDSAAINLGPTHAREDLHVISCKHYHSIIQFYFYSSIHPIQAFLIFGLPQIHVTCFLIGMSTFTEAGTVEFRKGPGATHGLNSPVATQQETTISPYVLVYGKDVEGLRQLMSAVPETFSQPIVHTTGVHDSHRTSDQVTFTKMWRMQSV